MVNKENKLRVNGKTYIYGDDLPEGARIDQTWVDQRVVILKKAVKETRIKEKKVKQKIETFNEGGTE